LEFAHEEHKYNKEKRVAIEALEKDGLRMERLANAFEVEAQVPGGEKTILHIGQLHLSSPDKKPDRREMQEIIQSQKHIEELLKYIVEKGAADTVYVEGITEEYKKTLDDARNLVAKSEHDSPDNVIADSVVIMNDAMLVEDSPTSNTSEEKSKADWLYAAKCELERQYKTIEAEYKTFTTTGHADSRYEKTFELWKQKGLKIQEAMERIRVRAEKIGSNELLRGDNIYLWGVAEKMYAENKIKIGVAESKTARVKTMAPYSLSERILSIPENGYKPAYRHRIREDVALDLINKDLPKEKVIPMIFGENHNFSESVKDFNKKTGSDKFGLIKIIPASHK
jgi:uncharacterized protein YukE